MNIPEDYCKELSQEGLPGQARYGAAAGRDLFLKRVTLGVTELARRRQLLYNINDLE